MTTNVRVSAESKQVEAPSTERDVQSLLEENLGLLRRLEELNKANDAFVKTNQDLEVRLRTAEAAVSDDKRSRRGYRGMRRFIVTLNIFIGLTLLLAPSILCIKGIIPAPGMIATAFGLAWTAFHLSWLDTLADRER